MWVGVGCMARFAVFPSSNMEAVFDRLQQNGTDASGACPIVVESILEDGKAANIAMQPTPTPTEGPHAKKGRSVGVGVLFHFLRISISKFPRDASED